MVYGAVVMGGVATTSGGVVSVVLNSGGDIGSAKLVPLDAKANDPIAISAPAPIAAEATLNCVAYIELLHLGPLG
jgi:hypothetical protein